MTYEQLFRQYVFTRSVNIGWYLKRHNNIEIGHISKSDDVRQRRARRTSTSIGIVVSRRRTGEPILEVYNSGLILFYYNSACRSTSRSTANMISQLVREYADEVQCHSHFESYTQPGTHMLAYQRRYEVHDTSMIPTPASKCVHEASFTDRLASKYGAETL